ncbi:MAG TPA: ABC transporter permease [Clostridia bacterium]|nr:ABC transporter permease [Clostridia bacterium]
MKTILDSLVQAFRLITSLNGEIYGIIALSLVVTILSTVISGALAVPSGMIIGSREFKGKKLLTRLISTFMGLPPVVAGLIVYLFLSRKGPLGSLGMLFTPAAMVIAQVLIIYPVITGITIGVVRAKVQPVRETCAGLGIGGWRMLLLLFHECRYSVMSAIIAGYGRAISEVGAVMLVGGNIQFYTRVMTTAIVLETGKGNYDRALALGIILLVISFIINWMLQRIQEST